MCLFVQFKLHVYRYEQFIILGPHKEEELWFKDFLFRKFVYYFQFALLIACLCTTETGSFVTWSLGFSVSLGFPPATLPDSKYVLPFPLFFLKTGSLLLTIIIAFLCI